MVMAVVVNALVVFLTDDTTLARFFATLRFNSNELSRVLKSGIDSNCGDTVECFKLAVSIYHDMLRKTFWYLVTLALALCFRVRGPFLALLWFSPLSTGCLTVFGYMVYHRSKYTPPTPPPPVGRAFQVETVSRMTTESISGPRLFRKCIKKNPIPAVLVPLVRWWHRDKDHTFLYDRDQMSLTCTRMVRVKITTGVHERSVVDKRPLSMRNTDLTHVAYDVEHVFRTTHSLSWRRLLVFMVLCYSFNNQAVSYVAFGNAITARLYGHNFLEPVFAMFPRFVYSPAQVVYDRAEYFAMGGQLGCVVVNGSAYCATVDEEVSPPVVRIHQYDQTMVIISVFLYPALNNLIVTLCLTALCFVPLLLFCWRTTTDEFTYLPFWLNVLLTASASFDRESAHKYLAQNGGVLMNRSFSVNIDDQCVAQWQHGTLRAALECVDDGDRDFCEGCSASSLLNILEASSFVAPLPWACV